jgi:hypothetical protein
MSARERREAVLACLDALRLGRSHRTKLSAVKALAGLDRLNLTAEAQEILDRLAALEDRLEGKRS